MLETGNPRHHVCLQPQGHAAVLQGRKWNSHAQQTLTLYTLSAVAGPTCFPTNLPVLCFVKMLDLRLTGKVRNGGDWISAWLWFACLLLWMGCTSIHRVKTICIFLCVWTQCSCPLPIFQLGYESSQFPSPFDIRRVTSLWYELQILFSFSLPFDFCLRLWCFGHAEILSSFF